ncbi:hypothetical protein TMatcc_001763 [Talaromyces marneffei ATCC 18224]|uniref:uncharacterized protein n=1 Tax=Talaromyces marneffei TaxID=37727 RepID=UPI0012A7F6F1|nr:uncharacterized protein EYB26_007037 [Talaromyces marneffei]KAE8551779.1 hypothetical protein EYB25_005669 [Talaromyces marneffei]QGA19348.1 hypothetical protein EYB26_007037 [Talaromyces marneffei]
MSELPSASVPLQSPTCTRVDFLDLPIEIRNNIYKRVLAVPHPLYIFQDSRSRLEIFAPEKPHQWLGLLFSNRQVSEEARTVLYGNNQFHFMETTPRLLTSFFNVIGYSNAGLLSRLSIKFPTFEISKDRPGEIRIHTDSLQSIQLLQQRCVKLTSLEALVYDPSEAVTDDWEIQSVRDVLAEINTQFRCIRSLKEIIVRVYTKPPSPSIRALMNELGWVVVVGGI